jgi:hydroxypyruvate reductase
MRDHAMQIFEAAVNAVKPQNLIPQYLKTDGDKLWIGENIYDLPKLDHIYLVAAGKAASAMAFEAEKILSSLISESIVITKYGHSLPIKSKTIESGHPVPDEQSLSAGKKVLELLHYAGYNDLVILLLSGGASSLMESLAGNISLQDLQILSELMLKKGLSISEINTIRKHLSLIKGGRFSAAAYPAKVHALILSDVPGDDLSIIASGPTVPDASTFEDVIAILEKYQKTDECPETILHHFQNGRSKSLNETPKPGDSMFQRTNNLLIGSNRIALNAAVDKASQLGYNPVIIQSDLKGEASEQASAFVNIILDYEGTKPACLLMGGETTVKIKGNGLGGRNQEFALASLVALQELESPRMLDPVTDIDSEEIHSSIKENGSLKILLVLSAGTDGTDGPTNATGAVIDQQTIQIVREQNLDAHGFLNCNDSYNFFKQVGGHIITGPTQTNVMDIVIALIQ